ncbi:MAG: hypothetical protein AB8F74_16665 [Saprospiraceae bacterium]
MDLKTQLLKEHSKENTLQIVDYIGQSTKRYAQLWQLVKTAEPPVPQRASWVLDHSPISYSKKVLPFLSEMIDEIQNLEHHDAIRRNVMKILAATSDIPEDQSAVLFDFCVELVINKNTAIAIKAFAMDVMVNIAMPFEELRNEVKVVLEDQVKHGSKGVKSRANKLLKKLNI